jgi:type VI protein secretion system component Hcp
MSFKVCNNGFAVPMWDGITSERKNQIIFSLRVEKKKNRAILGWAQQIEKLVKNHAILLELQTDKLLQKHTRYKKISFKRAFDAAHWGCLASHTI